MKVNETCAICGCNVHRDGEYGKPTIKGRSHATEHHLVAERYFGRSRNRPGTTSDPIFTDCPWGFAGASSTFCYECHEELLHNPVLLPEDVERFAQLVKRRGLSETQKPADRLLIGRRIQLFRDVISAGIRQLLVEDE